MRGIVRFCLVASLGLALPAAAQTLAPPLLTPAAPAKPQGAPADTAFGAYQRGYFLTALHEAQRRVADDPKDAAAMTLIGEIYVDGYAVPHNDVEAARWFRVAAGLGDREAAFALGVMLLNGATGVPADHDGAKALFEQAGAKGQAGALYNLGVMAIGGGPGGVQDFAKAADFFHRAADAGDGDAAYSYGVLLREGKGVPLDIGESARWLKRASDAGVAAGQVEYAIALFNGIGVTKDEAGAAKLFLRAAARNNPIAQNRLAHLFVLGRGVNKDLVEAATWNRFAKAAGIDDPQLDAATAGLTPEENKRVDDLIRRQSSF
jgi:hypothetical protein